MEGKAAEGSPATRWVVRAEIERSSLPQVDKGSDDATESIRSVGLRGNSLTLERSEDGQIQLSLFSRLESPESTDIDIQDLRFTRKEAHRADIRMDFVLKRRRPG